jgi:hypothetical protein
MKAPLKRIQPLLERWSYAPPSVEIGQEEPRKLWRTAYRYWMKFARALGKANAFVLLTIVYVLLIGPAALVLKILGRDLLDRKAGKEPSFWYNKLVEEMNLERSKRQF